MVKKEKGSQVKKHLRRVALQHPVQGLLEEATKVLKRVSTATPGLKKGVSSQNPQRDEMMPNLQQQLDQLRESTTPMKVMRLGRLVRNDSGGLLDSGATHPLRPRGDDEDESRLRSVEVVLADGAKKQLHMTSGGTMSHHQEVEGLLTTALDCNVTCGKDKTCKWSIR